MDREVTIRYGEAVARLLAEEGVKRAIDDYEKDLYARWVSMDTETGRERLHQQMRAHQDLLKLAKGVIDRGEQARREVDRKEKRSKVK